MFQPALDWPEMTMRLLISFFLGLLVGLERETHDRPAGLRTHALVCLGSCVFMLTSAAVAGRNFDPGRIAAGVVAGIGFLGAGTIMRHGNWVTGLTTAASIWCAAAIGVAVGAGWVQLALAAGLLVYVALRGLKPLAEHVAHRGHYPQMNLVVADAAVLGPLTEALQEVGSELREVQLSPKEKKKQLALVAAISVPPTISPDVLLAVVRAVEGVSKASWVE